MSIDLSFCKIQSSFPGLTLETSENEWVLKNSSKVSRLEIRELLDANFKVRKARNSDGNLRIRKIFYLNMYNLTPLSKIKDQRHNTIFYAGIANNAQYKNVEELIPEISVFLSNYTVEMPLVEDQIQQSVSLFVQKTLQFLPGHFSIIPNEPCNGISGDIVYRIVDPETKEVIGIIKTFKSDSKNFLPEVWGIDFSSRLENKLKIHGVGKMYSEGNMIFLLAMKVAKGKQVQEILEQPFKLTQDPDLASKPELLAEKRQIALNNAYEALWAAGQGLAELHLLYTSEPLPLHESFIDELRRALDWFILKLQQFPIEGIEIEILKNYVEHIITLTRPDLHRRGVIHYDAHVGNMFYDKSSKAHSFIDLAGIAKSLADNRPIGFPGWDYHKTVENIKTHMLSDNEKSQSISVFKDGYVTRGGTIPTPAQFNFLFLYDELEAIRNEIDSPNKEQWWWKQLRLPVLERSIESVRQKLQLFNSST